MIESAIAVSPKSKTDSGKLLINVGGAIRLPSGEVITAYLGKLAPGDHTEFTLLEKAFGSRPSRLHISFHSGAVY